MEFLVDNILITIFLLCISFIIVYFFLKDYMIILFDPIFMGIITISISLLDISLLFFYDYLDLFEYIKVISIIFIFLMVAKINSKFINLNNFKLKLNDFLSKPITKEEKIFFFIIYILAISTTAFFSVMMIGAAIGDERILLGGQYRIIDILRQGTARNLVYILCFSFYYRTKKKKYIYYIVPLGILNLLMGAKSFLLTIVIYYILFEGINCYNKKRNKIYFKSIRILIFTIIGGILSLVFFGGDIVDSFNKIMFRIFMSSDTYLYAYIWGDYKELYNVYNPLAYLLHPILRLLGTEGYSYPLGVALFGAIGKGYDGFGPNAIYPILVLVLGAGDIISTYLIALIFSMIIFLIINFIIRVFSIENGFMINYYVLSLYVTFLSVYSDIGLWQQLAISLTIVIIIVKFTCDIIKRLRR